MMASPSWVRAVDGVSFDIRRGEILCLVGESGCGKTTTGKALLRLVEPRGGDVLFETPDEEYRRYEEARTRAEGPRTEKTLEDIRRKYSLTWKADEPLTRKQLLATVVAMGIAFFLALTGPALAATLLSEPFTSPLTLFAAAIGIGIILGIIGMLPPVRPTKRVSNLLAVLAVVAVNLSPFLGLYMHHVRTVGAAVPFPIEEALERIWVRGAFGIVLGQIFAPGLAAGISRLLLDQRLRSEGLAGIKMRSLRRRLHLIFQDPYESLNPKQSVFEIVAEPLRVNRLTASAEETMALVLRALNDAGLRPAEDFLYRFPHELSGGQRQRVSIAAALVLEPDFIVADEPVSMLDVSIRTEILQLLLELRRTRGLTYLFITHDLSLAWVIADRIAVMYLGKIVEVGTAEQVIASPQHPYTKALISVVPSPDPRKKAQRIILKGERPDPVNMPTGCRFHPRCPVAFERCGWNADEVSEELQSLQIQGRLPEIATIRTVDPRTVGLDLAPGASAENAAASIRNVVAAEKDARLVLRGIADFRPATGSLQVVLHEWSEPKLVDIQPGNAVACHLVTPPKALDAITAGVD